MAFQTSLATGLHLGPRNIASLDGIMGFTRQEKAEVLCMDRMNYNKSSKGLTINHSQSDTCAYS